MGRRYRAKADFPTTLTDQNQRKDRPNGMAFVHRNRLPPALTAVLYVTDAGRERKHSDDPWPDGHQETAVVPGVDAVPVQKHDVARSREERDATDECSQAPTRRHRRGRRHGRQSDSRQRRSRGVRHGHFDRVPRSFVGRRYVLISDTE